MDKYWLEREVYDAGRRALAKKQSPSNKFITYLTKFQHDQLTTGTITRLPSFASQHDKLVEIMRKKFPDQGFRQIISGFDTALPRFWELFLAMHYVTREIEITNNVGFDRVELAAGISTAREVPHVEFTIVGSQLRQAVSFNATPPEPAKPRKSTIQAPVLPRTVSIVMKGFTICAEADDGKLYMIKTLRADSTPYRFIDYVLSHRDEKITGTVIRTAIKADGVHNMSELVRQCGFTKNLLPLKPVFFPGTSKTAVRFRRTAELDSEQMDILTELDQYRKKS